jgi:predicted ATP-dependent endonuclease of OLD family
LKGSNNSERKDTLGIKLLIEFDENYKEEYETYIKEPDEIHTIPTEYYTVNWYSFAFNSISKRSLKINSTMIDTSTIRLQYGSDYYIQKIIDDSLDIKDKTKLSLAYRKLKQTFAGEEALSQINDKLREEKGKISDKELKVSIDISQKTSWETNLTSYLDDIPFQYIGKGDQNILKILLALERNIEESHVILIEEPENHLSYSTMNYLINKIQEKCLSKQVILCTHSTFVMNKLGIEKVIMLGEDQSKTTLKDLNPDTQSYFKKLPGYDTLRLIIAKKAILVEGPSDELFTQKAYMQINNGKLPIDNGIDVISVRGLSFKRFLEIAVLLNKKVVIITDNDGDYLKNVEEKYSEYLNKDNIRICYDKENETKTLEPQIVKINDLDMLNEIFGRNDQSKDDLVKYMENNKADSALKLFETQKKVNIPAYILNAINE